MVVHGDLWEDWRVWSCLRGSLAEETTRRACDGTWILVLLEQLDFRRKRRRNRSESESLFSLSLCVSSLNFLSVNLGVMFARVYTRIHIFLYTVLFSLSIIIYFLCVCLSLLPYFLLRFWSRHRALPLYILCGYLLWKEFVDCIFPLSALWGREKSCAIREN